MARPTEYDRWKKAGLLKKKLDTIKGMAAMGHSDVKIALALNIKDATLRKMIKDYIDVEDAYCNGKEQVGGLIRNERVAMSMDIKNTPPELRYKILNDLEKQFNDYEVVDNTLPKEGFDERGVPMIINNFIKEYEEEKSTKMETSRQLSEREEAENNE